MKDEDFVDKLFIAHSHDTLLCFSDRGQCYWLKVYQLPLASRGSRGKPIVNLLQLGDGERITAVLAVREFDDSTIRVHGDFAGHGQKDAAVCVLAAASERHHRGVARRVGLPGGRRADGRRSARSC